MSAINDGGPIAPNMTHTVPVEGHDGVYRRILMQSEGGLSKREWFAGMAMQGWLASFGPNDECSSSGTKEAIARQSYQLADAMLAALVEKGGDQ